MKEITFSLADVIYQKLQVWAQSLGLSEGEALRVIVGKEVQGVYLPSERVPLPPATDTAKEIMRMNANAMCSSGMVKCAICGGKLVADELIENDGTCYNCKPKPVDVEGMLKDAMNKDKKEGS
jgi:hypothetical protein